MTDKVSVEVETGTLTPKQVWDMKEELQASVEESIEQWDKLSEEEQDHMVKVVREGLERMIDRLPAVLRASMKLVPDEYVDFNIKILIK